MDWTNTNRADRGFEAMLVGSDFDADGDTWSGIVDTIANLLHLAHREDLDVAVVLRVAHDHFEVEIDEEQHPVMEG